MKIDSSRIAKIWDNLQSSSTIITIDDRNDIPNDRGLYLVHCPLLKSHEYLRWLYTALTRAKKNLNLVNFDGLL